MLYYVYNRYNNIEKGDFLLNSASIISAVISGAICVLFPIIVLIYFKKKEKINLKPVIIGAIVLFMLKENHIKLLSCL